MARIVTFGETLLRLQAPGHERLLQSPRFDACFGGAEANVAVGLARLGHESTYVTRLPDNPLGDAAIRSLRAEGVSVARVGRGEGRLGLYFAERGAGQRPSAVHYDRTGSVFARLDPKSFDWREILRGADAFHLTGITPALGDGPREAARSALRAARAAEAVTSFDLNYRQKLWRAGDAQVAIEPLLREVDLLIASAEDLWRVLGVVLPAAEGAIAKRDAGAFRDACADLARRFDLRAIAVTLTERGASSSEGVCQALLYDAALGTLETSPRHAVQPVDRIGAGDAFAAALLHARLEDREGAESIRFALAAAVLALTTPGDFPRATAAEIERLASGGSAEIDR